MQKILILAIILSVNSCSTLTSSIPILNGVEKVEIDQEENKRPEFYVEKFKFSKNYRKIAGLETSDLDLTNRQLYFLTYYKQYLTMGKILGKENTINSCPSFHHIYLEYKDKLEEYSDDYISKLNFNYVKRNNYLVTQYPVLSLPYSQSEDLYSTLIEENWEDSQTHFTHALEYYYGVEKQEIATLCDRGVSPGYYVYENLVQYFREKKDFHRTYAGLKALLKIPVMANMVILDNLSSPNYALTKTNDFDTWLMQRSNLAWFSEYRESLVQKRMIHISAKY